MIGGVCVKELIREIRSKANMSQEQFASALGTTVVSINRWENGKSIPNQMAQINIYQFSPFIVYQFLSQLATHFSHKFVKILLNKLVI